jgi:hypothetical protein
MTAKLIAIAVATALLTSVVMAVLLSGSAAA